jgi:putative oxidoreductase
MLKSDATSSGLFIIRLTLFLLMIMWALLKLTAPAAYGASEDGTGIFGSFYGISLSQSLVFSIGLVQIAFLFAFLAGVAKFITTGGVMVMNLATLLVSLPAILPVFVGEGNILFAASFPIFGASLALFLMREQDTLLSFGKKTAVTSANLHQGRA